MDRRQFIKQSLVIGASMGLPHAAEAGEIQWSALNNESRYPVSAVAWREFLKTHDVPYDGLVTSLTSENNYNCEVRGQLPLDLQGTLFRTGPGLFERGTMRRRMQIDADGMIRRFQISNGQATFTNKHIRTQKFVDEEKAGRYIYPSFSMQVPRYELLFTNSLLRVKNQASVTAFSFGGRLFATDEIQLPTELNISNLNTKGEVSLTSDSSVKYMAHYRITHFGSAKLLHLAAYNPANGALQVHTFNEQFKCIRKSQEVHIRRSFHDWLATPDYFVFLLPPLYMSNLGLMKAAAGLGVVADAINFKTDEVAQILIIPRDGRPSKVMNLPENLDSWHSINAYQPSASQISVDFVGSKKRSPVASN